MNTFDFYFAAVHSGCVIIASVQNVGILVPCSVWWIHFRCFLFSNHSLHPQIPTTTHPKEVSTTSSADMLQISWNDGHISQHDLPWLHHHRQPQSSVPSIPIRQKSLWTSSLEIPSLSFEYVMQETEGLRQWLFNTVRSLSPSSFNPSTGTMGRVNGDGCSSHHGRYRKVGSANRIYPRIALWWVLGHQLRLGSRRHSVHEHGHQCSHGHDVLF